MASYYAVQAVQHGPLYFEDEMENVGEVTSECPSGYTWLDILAVPYSDARWMLNTIALPVSMVVNPPWQRMCSDGEPGTRPPLGLTLDAAPCAKPVPTPFDLKCSEQQAQDLAQLSRRPAARHADAGGPDHDERASGPASGVSQRQPSTAAFDSKTITADARRQPCLF